MAGVEIPQQWVYSFINLSDWLLLLAMVPRR